MVAYRFEKVYRLSKKDPAKMKSTNSIIIELLREYHEYID